MIQNARGIDIDHVVPLAWSWDRGARQWSDDKREKFANDPVNLLPVEASFYSYSTTRRQGTGRLASACGAVRLRRSLLPDFEALQA